MSWQTRIRPRTRDRRRSHLFAARPYDVSNAAHDHEAPHREDYSVELAGSSDTGDSPVGLDARGKVAAFPWPIGNFTTRRSNTAASVSENKIPRRAGVFGVTLSAWRIGRVAAISTALASLQFRAKYAAQQQAAADSPVITTRRNGGSR